MGTGVPSKEGTGNDKLLLWHSQAPPLLRLGPLCPGGPPHLPPPADLYVPLKTQLHLGPQTLCLPHNQVEGD